MAVAWVPTMPELWSARRWSDKQAKLRFVMTLVFSHQH